MARPGVSYLDVAKAATKLVEQNIRPSIEAIRRELGTGSNSTITHHLRQWRERQGHQLEAQQGLPDTLLVATKGLYEALRAEAEQKIKMIEQESQQNQALLKQQLGQQQQVIDTLMQQKQTAEGQRADLQQQLADLHLKLEAFKHALEKETTAHALSQARLADKIADNERLSEQVQHAQHNLEHYRESLRQQREEEKQRYEAQIAKFEQRAQLSQAALADAQQTVAAQAQHIKSLEHQHEQFKQAQRQLQEQSTGQALALQKQQLAYKTLQEKHQRQTEGYQALVAEIKESKTQAHQLEILVEKTQGRLETVEQTLKGADAKITQLQDKNLTLMQKQAVLLAQLKQLSNTTVQDNKG